MDITNFMTWFLNQVVSIFTQVFNIMEDIEFMGTNLLQVCITIIIIGTIIPILITIGNSFTAERDIIAYNHDVKRRNKEQYNRAEGKE